MAKTIIPARRHYPNIFTLDGKLDEPEVDNTIRNQWLSIYTLQQDVIDTKMLIEGAVDRGEISADNSPRATEIVRQTIMQTVVNSPAAGVTMVNAQSNRLPFINTALQLDGGNNAPEYDPVNKALTIRGTLDITGASTLTGAVNALSTLTVGGNLASTVDAVIIDSVDLTADGQRDSLALLWTAKGFETSTAHDADWKSFVETINDDGTQSKLIWQSRVDAGSYEEILSLSHRGGSQIPNVPPTSPDSNVLRLGVGNDRNSEFHIVGSSVTGWFKSFGFNLFIGTSVTADFSIQTNGLIRFTALASNNNGDCRVANNLQIIAPGTDGFLQIGTVGSPDLILHRDAADTWAQRRDTTAQAFNIYNTWTSATVNELGEIGFIPVSDTFVIGTKKGSVGGTARDLVLRTDETEALRINQSQQINLQQGGSAAAPALVFNGNLATGIHTSSSIALVFSVSGNAIAAVTRSGVPVERFQLSAGCFLTWLSGNAESGGAQFALSREVTDGFSAPVGDLALANTNFLVYQQKASNTEYHRTGIKHRTETLSGVSGATAVTTIGILPDGALILGVTTNVSVALGVTNGTTGYEVGDGVDADKWGAIVGTSTAVFSDDVDFTVTTIDRIVGGPAEVTITAVGGNFDGTGDIEIVVHYIEVGARK